MVDVRANFSGSIPEYYDSCMGAAIFAPFAEDLVRRLAPRPSGGVLEIACGTGIVTQRLRARLDPAVRLVASDLSKSMLDYARRKLHEPAGIEWREADACKLPFADGEFGAVVCAFGVMFVPDRQAAFREARRVLKDGGTFLFDVWDRIEELPHGAANAAAIESFFPGDPEMRFTMPYDMYDHGLLRKLLAETGFEEVRIETKRLPVGGVSARTLATGQIRGTPRSAMIEKRGVSLDAVIDKATEELTRIGGADPYRGYAQAVVVEACALPL
ncbi:MAG: class I SAM-dependent methyltransferase [Betaproteobacteria bacterium]